MASVTHHLGSLAGTSVLDLYAGSGALGLEAASRGATLVELVERDRGAARVIAANAQRLGLPVRVVVAPVLAHLRGPASAQYDLVLADPPYAVDPEAVTAMLELLGRGHWLSPDALVVVERAARTPMHWPDFLTDLGSRTYSQTAVWYGRASAPLPADPTAQPGSPHPAKE